jgi:hypothetical protein
VSWPESPRWLTELQLSFGSLLRTPLERASGSLCADTEAYDADLVRRVKSGPASSRAERLAVYHRQYWFRLLTALQRAYPLTARLVGFWHFNELAARHLAASPPRGFDLDDAVEGWERQLTSAAASGWSSDVDLAAVTQAARIDAAFHRILRAPPTSPLALRPADAARLPTALLALSPTVALIEEDWALCERRALLGTKSEETRVALGPRHASTRHLLLTRRELQLGVVPLEPLEARLLALLPRFPLAEALGRLEAACPAAELATLPARAQGWLARSVKLGVWSHVEEVSPAAVTSTSPLSADDDAEQPPNEGGHQHR